MKYTVKVALFNLEYESNRKEYEQLLSNCLNHRTQYKMLKEPEKIMKTFTKGEQDIKETYQEVWILVEYSITDEKAKKVDEVFQ